MQASELESRLGHVFAARELLVQALTHRSFGLPNNERLEFLGDSVLNCAVSRLIYARDPDMSEGGLSRLRANLVNQDILAGIAGELGIGPLLRLGDGEIKTGGAERPSILADALEALLGAIFLDAGFAAADAAIQRLFASRLSGIDAGRPRKDAKTTLQEWLQARRLPLPQYTVERIEGEAHRQVFHVRCEVPSQAISVVGQGASRRIAEQDAAACAFAILPNPALTQKS